MSLSHILVRLLVRDEIDRYKKVLIAPLFAGVAVAGWFGVDVQETAGKINDQYQHAQADLTQLNQAVDQVTSVGDELQDFGVTTLQTRLIQARSLAFFILRADRQVTEDVYNPRDSSGRQKYRLFFETSHLKGESISLKVRVLELWSNVDHPWEPTPDLEPNTPFPLRDAPGLSIFVDSIKRQHLSHSFALLHVAATGGPAAQ